MKIVISMLASILCLMLVTTANAQTAANQTAAAAKVTSEPVALVTDKMESPATSSDAVKVKAEINPVSKRLTVRTDVPGPVRVEINDDEGRPVMTKDMISGDKAANIDVSRLPTGFYIVRCTSGERSGVRRVHLGQ